MKRVIGLVLGQTAAISLLAFAAASVNAADSKGAWSIAAQMTTARTEIVADPFDGKIYVAGGQTPTVQDRRCSKNSIRQPVVGAIFRRCRGAPPIPALRR
jgi:hypothetical protein